MQTDRELMQQALVFIEEMSGGYGGDLIEALRARLAQPEPKPVAWMDDFGFVQSASEVDGTGLRNIPLYTTPPQREWQGLTDEDIGLVNDEFLDGALWAETKLKEKNT